MPGSGDASIAMSSGLFNPNPEISEAFTVAPEVVYSPMLPAPDTPLPLGRVTNRFDPDTAMQIGRAHV